MKLVVNTILLSFFYVLILAMGLAAFKVTGPDQPPVGLWIGMVVFFIVCCIPLWIWRSRLNRNQEKVSIIRSPILWWKSQPVYSNFLLILVPGLFILVFIMVGLDTTGLLNGILGFLLAAYVVASVLYLSWDLLVKRKLHKNPVFWVVIGVIALMIYLPSITGTSIEGLYSTAMPSGGGEGKDGYPVISLKEDYTVEWVVRYRGDYTVGRWSEEDGGIRISGMVHHDIDGLYKWNEHPHGEGIESPGMVLSEKSSYPMGKVLFPVDGVQNP